MDFSHTLHISTQRSSSFVFAVLHTENVWMITMIMLRSLNGSALTEVDLLPGSWAVGPSSGYAVYCYRMQETTGKLFRISWNKARGNNMKVVYYRKLAMLTKRNNAALHQTVQSCASQPQVAASAPQQKRFSNV